MMLVVAAMALFVVVSLAADRPSWRTVAGLAAGSTVIVCAYALWYFVFTTPVPPAQ